MMKLRAAAMARNDALILALRRKRETQTNDTRKADVWLRGMLQTAARGEAGANVPRLTIRAHLKRSATLSR